MTPAVSAGYCWGTRRITTPAVNVAQPAAHQQRSRKEGRDTRRMARSEAARLSRFPTDFKKGPFFDDTVKTCQNSKFLEIWVAKNLPNGTYQVQISKKTCQRRAWGPPIKKARQKTCEIGKSIFPKICYFGKFFCQIRVVKNEPNGPFTP